MDIPHIIDLAKEVLSLIGVGAIGILLLKWAREFKEKHQDLTALDQQIKSSLREAVAASGELRQFDRERFDKQLGLFEDQITTLHKRIEYEQEGVRQMWALLAHEADRLSHTMFIGNREQIVASAEVLALGISSLLAQSNIPRKRVAALFHAAADGRMPEGLGGLEAVAYSLFRMFFTVNGLGISADTAAALMPVLVRIVSPEARGRTHDSMQYLAALIKENGGTQGALVTVSETIFAALNTTHRESETLRGKPHEFDV